MPGGHTGDRYPSVREGIKAKESDWPPAPDGPIYLVMRLCWPKETPPSILPAGEDTWKLPAIVVSK